MSWGVRGGELDSSQDQILECLACCLSKELELCPLSWGGTQSDVLVEYRFGHLLPADVSPGSERMPCQLHPGLISPSGPGLAPPHGAGKAGRQRWQARCATTLHRGALRLWSPS